DTDGCQWLARTISQWREAGHTICLATHDASRAEQLADATFELRSSQLHAMTMCRTSEPAARHAIADCGFSTRNRAA
ncbi:MAG: hypothetical protein OES79_04585, partial [Planctomycetota bacterium]|nr:hypothetical protein [Planctomycetota bacterium]